jgi:hypothetical protein
VELATYFLGTETVFARNSRFDLSYLLWILNSLGRLSTLVKVLKDMKIIKDEEIDLVFSISSYFLVLDFDLLFQVNLIQLFRI